MPSALYLIRGTPQQVQQLLGQALQARGYRLTVQPNGGALAERGSKVGNFFGGVFAQYFAFNVSVVAVQGGTQVAIEKGNSGLMGGIAGAIRVKNEFDRFTTDLGNHLQGMGVLTGFQRA